LNLKNVKKLNEGKNGIDFSSNFDYAKKSLAKVINHRIEKLFSLLNANETQLNLTNRIEISIECENATNETSDNNPCSSTIKVEPFFEPKSKRFKVNFSIRKHTCEMCKKRFLSQGHLNIHSRIHLKQKPFTCDQCQKNFTQKDNLITHKRVHSGEKPYLCEFCQKKFSQLSNLIRHIRVHTGEKPFSCDVCHKKFARPDHLIHHKRIHTGEKPYSCDLCLKKFTRPNHLTAHKRNSHKRETVPL
jgi:uncharacterized Zn-finger protein